MHSFKTNLELDKNSLGWDYRIYLPTEFISLYKDTDKRVLCTVNTKVTWHCALMSDGLGGYFIVLNQENRKKLKVDEGDTLNVLVEKDQSEYGMFVPEVFKVMCEQDPEGNAVFHTLTKGKQRTLLHLIGKFKNEEKQLEKVLILFDYLKEVEGKLDFKELNTAFKNNVRFKR